MHIIYMCPCHVSVYFQIVWDLYTYIHIPFHYIKRTVSVMNNLQLTIVMILPVLSPLHVYLSQLMLLYYTCYMALACIVIYDTISSTQLLVFRLHYVNGNADLRNVASH